MMNDNLQADFIACNDPFLFTVELPALYRSSSSFESTVASLLDLSHDAPPGVRTRLLLGIAYAKRVHSEDEPSALLEHTAALIRTAGSDSELVLIGHTVEAVLTLMRLGDYSRGMVILETVHAELRYGSTLGALYGIVRRWMGLGHMLLSQHKEAETTKA